ncbi:holo-ACP synthase [Halocatena halophila]|uniref:holo-ACP synthase n=1 Tax=Halocatena halophila TaxID=2814576 RepID=UPI0038B33842
MNDLLVCSGIDVISITRIKQALSRDTGFKQGIFSEGEIDYSDSKERPARFFGGRWCVKESFIKALQEMSATESVHFDEIIVGKEGGSPQLELLGDTKRVFERSLPSGMLSYSISISISHDEVANIASASCIIVILT